MIIKVDASEIKDRKVRNLIETCETATKELLKIKSEKTINHTSSKTISCYIKNFIELSKQAPQFSKPLIPHKFIKALADNSEQINEIVQEIANVIGAYLIHQYPVYKYLAEKLIIEISITNRKVRETIKNYPALHPKDKNIYTERQKYLQKILKSTEKAILSIYLDQDLSNNITSQEMKKIEDLSVKYLAEKITPEEGYKIIRLMEMSKRPDYTLKSIIKTLINKEKITRLIELNL